jgi:hypothetical protein
MAFTIIDNAVSVQSRKNSSKYVEALGNLSLSTKNPDGTFSGSAFECEKEGQVLSFREAAKRLGVGIVTRKAPSGKTRVWKIAATDKPARKVAVKTESEATVTPKPKTKKSK